jgi:hypothetical protein
LRIKETSVRLTAVLLVLSLIPRAAAAQRTLPRDTAAQNAAIRRADSTRIANRACLHTDVLMNVCKRQDTVYMNGRAVAVVRKPGVALDPPARVDTVYLDGLRAVRADPRRRVDTVYVQRLRARTETAPR